MVLNGTSKALDVTFDRPMQAGSFTPSQVLQIMGPTGSISGPQYFSNNVVNQSIPKSTVAGLGTLSETLTVPDYDGTFTVADVTLSLSITDASDSTLTAELIAPNGTSVALFSNVGGHGQNFTSTVLDDAALLSITSGTAPFLQGVISQPVRSRVWSAQTLAARGRSRFRTVPRVSLAFCSIGRSISRRRSRSRPLIPLTDSRPRSRSASRFKS